MLAQEAYILFYAKQGTPWFSSLMEEPNPCLDPNILNTSPKSVLDNVDSVCTIYPSVASIDNCDANESRDKVEGVSSDFSCGTRHQRVEVSETRDAIVGSSGPLLCRSKQDELGSNDSKDNTPINNTSMLLEANNPPDGTSYNDEKMCTTSSLGRSNSHKGIDENKDDGFHPLTPPGSPSPDKVSLESSGKQFHSSKNYLYMPVLLNCSLELIQ